MRADIDALAITEQTDVPYTSQNNSVMHACGHDCHIAMMLGALRILSRMTDQLAGEIRVDFSTVRGKTAAVPR